MNVPPGEASLFGDGDAEPAAVVSQFPTAADGGIAGVHPSFSRPFASLKICDQCGQEFGKVDSFAPEGSNVTLRCSKYKMNNKTGMRDIPHGSECFPCQAHFWQSFF